VRFELDSDQKDFAAALESLLSGADTVGAARAWADGDHDPGLKLWARLAELGVLSLATEATPVELVIAFEALGRHAVPGPWVESAAYLPIALGREVEAVSTLALPPHVPYALDADVADHVYVGATPAESVAEMVVSVDRTRRLFVVTGAGEPDRAAFDLAVLATSAQLLGAGERVLADSVTYVKQRKQFGREIGSYQAIKHALADVRIALDFARPLVYGAAVGAIDVSAAKVAGADAAYLASRTGLQVHGAIGYTQEFDLSLWLTKIRALVGAWGTPDFHRARILQQLGAS
jgi:alkylation response protein AidB-like acyl-CoA dehydrogenase